MVRLAKAYIPVCVFFYLTGTCHTAHKASTQGVKAFLDIGSEGYQETTWSV